MANSRRTCQILLNHPILRSKSARVSVGAALILCRKFTGTPTVHNNQKKRNDVYFLTDQERPMHLLDDAIDCVRAYSLFGAEPIDLLLEVNMAETNEKKKNVNVNALKGLLSLPKSVSSAAQTVLVFAEGEAAEQARQAGASFVGGAELIKQVEGEELKFDHCLSTLDFLPRIKHLPKILRDKMPHPRKGTATDDIPGALEMFRDKEYYEVNDGRLRQTVAFTSFTNDEIRSNVREVMKTVISHKTKGTKNEKYYKHVGIVIPPGPEVDLLWQDLILY